MEQKLSDADYIRLFDLAKRVALRTGVTSSCDAEDIAHDVLVGLLRKLKQPSPHRIAFREVHRTRFFGHGFEYTTFAVG